MNNKPTFLIYIFLAVVFAAMSVSCGGGGGGGGGGAVSYAPDSNTPHNGGDAGGWGIGTETGTGMGGSTIEEDNATLLLRQSAALSYQKVDIDLIVNGEHFSIPNVTATTTTEVLPKIPIGASVSGTAIIYLLDGTTRVAELEMTEIGIHNNLIFKVPYNYKCIDATTGAETTSGTYLSREGIDLSAYTIAPIEGWKCLEDGSVHAGSYVTGVRGDITLQPVYGTGSSYIASFVTPVQSASALSFTSADIVQLPSLSSPNLTFAGWYEDSAFSGQSVDVIPAGTDENKTYYAKWTATVTFNRNDANETYPSETKVYGECISRPSTDPTRTGFTFKDWRVYSNGVMASAAYDFNSAVTENIELIANWDAEDYTIHYESPNVTPDWIPADSSYTVLTGFDLRTQIPTKSGLSFEGWYENPNLTGSKVEQIPIGQTGARTYYAKWEARVTFECNGGTGISTSSVVQYNRLVSQPSNPTKQYYTFGDWYMDSGCTAAYDFTNPVTQNMTLYAGWNPIEHNIIYYMSGVSGAAFTPLDSDKKFYEHQAKTLPTSGPVCTNLTFAGWYTNSNLNDSSHITSIPQGTTQAITLYPKWSATVTYKLNDGTDTTHETQTVDYGEITTSLSAPTRQYYDFANKWYTNSSCTQEYNFSTPVTQNLTLYAKWNRRQHNVTYNMSGVTDCTFTPINSFYENEGIPQASLPSPSKTGLTFVGWHKRPDCTDSRVTSIAVGTDDNVNLYAEWTARVTFNSNGGSGVNPSYRDVPYNTTVTAPTTSWTDHRCLGWYQESACTTEFDFTQRITQNKTIYAKWITSFSGSGEKSIEYESGKTNYVVELNNFQNDLTPSCASLNIKNDTPGAVMNVQLSIVGTNWSIGDNHGGLKLTSGNINNQGGTINVVFTTSSTGTLELGFGWANSGDIQVEKVTANFSVDPDCTISDMKVGDTTYTDFNLFITAAKAETDSSRKASFKITRN